MINPFRSDGAIGQRARCTLASVLIFAVLVLQACSVPSRLAPEPQALVTKAVAIDTPRARYDPDEQVTEIFDEGTRAVEWEMRDLGVAGRAISTMIYVSGVNVLYGL